MEEQLPDAKWMNIDKEYKDGNIHMHHPEWGHQLVVQQQIVSNHSCAVTDDIRFSIIAAIAQKPGIWDSQREKTSGASRKELFADVTREVNQQHHVEPPLSTEEVEKQWKNLKDTFIKTRKKVTYNTDGTMISPKWKFFTALCFLEQLLRPGKRRYEEEEMLPPNLVPVKRLRGDDDAEEDDEYMAFCRSLVFPLREIGMKDRIQWVKLQKDIRDLIHDSQMNVLLAPNSHQHLR